MSTFTRLRAQSDEERMSLSDYTSLFDINNPYINVWGAGMWPGQLVQSWSPEGKKSEPSPGDYTGNAVRLRSNGPIFTLMALRLRLFSQVRWSYQQLRSGRPGDLFSDPALDLVNADPCLNQWMIRHVDLAGNFYGKIEDGKIWPLRPDWVQVIGDGPLDDYDTEIVGYAYFPGGINKTRVQDAETFLPREIIHWAPDPDPLAKWRGMSWLTPVIRDVANDSKMTLHVSKFLDNAATPNMVVTFDQTTSFENFLKFKEQFQLEHEGVQNAYKTLFLGGGADSTVVGTDLRGLDFKATQGIGETRLANAAGIHPVVAGFSEGMQGSSLNAGNFGQARRSTADSLLHPLWRSAADALGDTLPVPSSARFFYDARDIPFLKEDAKDDAEIRQADSVTVMNLVREGFDPVSVLDFMAAGGDFKRLKHSGFVSVQLWKPGDESPRKPDPNADSPSQPKGGTSTPSNSTSGRSLRIIRNDDGFVEAVDVAD